MSTDYSKIRRVAAKLRLLHARPHCTRDRKPAALPLRFIEPIYSLNNKFLPQSKELYVISRLYRGVNEIFALCLMLRRADL